MNTIHPIDRLNGTVPTESVKPTPSQGGNFQEIFTQTVSQTTQDSDPLKNFAALNALQAIQPGNPNAPLSEMEKTGVQVEVFKQVMAEVDNFFSGLEDYSKSLDSENDDNGLKSAWNALMGMDQTLKNAKASLANLPHDEALAGIINEMDILATTEKFKFNRGDYVM